MASVAGIFFDPVRTAFWSSSLIWALLATLLLSPALVMLYDENLTEKRSAHSESSRQWNRTDQETESSRNAGVRSSSLSFTDKRSFIESAEAAYPVGNGNQGSTADREESQSERR